MHTAVSAPQPGEIELVRCAECRRQEDMGITAMEPGSTISVEGVCNAKGQLERVRSPSRLPSSQWKYRTSSKFMSLRPMCQALCLVLPRADSMPIVLDVSKRLSRGIELLERVDLAFNRDPKGT
jgi:hypothetical protein